MKFIDDSSKKVKWWNRNYFYVGTIVVIAINILLYAFLGGDFEEILTPDNRGHWGDGFYFVPTARVFLNAFSHANWQHVLLNMLCFLFIGFYLERKTGSFGLLAYVVFGAYFSGIATATNDLSVIYHGFSGVIYFLYAVIIVDYIFSFQNHKKNKTNIILGAIILALMYLAMCFTEGTSGFGFTWYPYDLLNNLGHGSSFVVGIVVALIIQISMRIGRKHFKEEK